MKFPNHIILDINKSSITTTNEYWITKYFTNLHQNNNLSSSFIIRSNHFLNKYKLTSNNLLMNQTKYTIFYKPTTNNIYLNSINNNFYNSLFKMKNKKNKYNYFFENLNQNKIFDENYLYNFFSNFNFYQNKSFFKSNKTWNLFDMNFIRKEKIYTKLKYSRVPQYDIVSGGVAAIFAGFLGFLISEKFGIELVDSGDFYFLFMYLVFLFFFLRLFLKLMDNEKLSWNVISLKWFFCYYQNIIILFFNSIKYLFNKLTY